MDDPTISDCISRGSPRQKATGHARDGLAAAVCRLAQPSAAMTGRTSTRMTTMNAWRMHSCPHNRAGTSGSSATKVYATTRPQACATNTQRRPGTNTHPCEHAWCVCLLTRLTRPHARWMPHSRPTGSGSGWPWPVDPASRNRISRKDRSARHGGPGVSVRDAFACRTFLPDPAPFCRRTRCRRVLAAVPGRHTRQSRESHRCSGVISWRRQCFCRRTHDTRGKPCQWSRVGCA